MRGVRASFKNIAEMQSVFEEEELTTSFSIQISYNASNKHLKTEM